MSPHAVADYGSTPATSTRSPSVASRGSHDHSVAPVVQSPYLPRTDRDELHDLVCIGFGPASLSVAVALHDSFEESSYSASNIALPKVAFLEKQPEFGWHSGMQIPGAKMQISFLKDMATMRNPRSHFTFINYLHSNRRLTQFSNVGTFLPRRLEYEDYMRWCAAHFTDAVNYGQEVMSVHPDQTTASGKPAKSFTIVSLDIQTGQTTSVHTKNVLIAVGGRPKIPQSLPQNHPRVVHSSQYRAFLKSSSAPNPLAPLRIAVIGGGQSAAEIFSDLPSSFPNSSSTLLIKASALRPSDDSPFVNEIFDPERVDQIYSTEQEKRTAQIKADKATNYGVVRIELLEHIYEELYTQRITHGNDEESWPRRIRPHTAVTSAKGLQDNVVRLDMSNSETGQQETLDVDLVFVASGYERDMHQNMLKDCAGLLDASSDGRFQVQRDYSVHFADGKVAGDAGVWLQGCNEGTHGLSDTLLSILSVRGGEVVESIFGQ